VELSNSQKKKQLSVQHNFMRDWDMAINEDWLRHRSSPRVVGVDPDPTPAPAPRTRALVMLSIAAGLSWTPPNIR
jgi:hypothetical protein